MAGAFEILKKLNYLTDYVDNAPQPSDSAPLAAGTAEPGTSKDYAREDHVHPVQTTVNTASKLAAKRTITLTGAVTGTGRFDGSADLTIDAALSGLDASKITSGVIDIARIPAAALERLIVVDDLEALLKLDSSNIQTGDTVQIIAASSIDGTSYPANAMFRVTDGAVFTGSQTEASVKARIVVYTAGAAASVPWSGVTGKPVTFAPSEHDHSAADITSGTLAAARGGTGRTDGKAVALAAARTISLAGDVTGSASFDGSDNVSISATLKDAAVQHSASGTRSAAIAANTNYTVPSYVVGSGHLQMYLDGLLCAGGTDAATCAYKEVGTSGSASTTIQFHQAVPAVMDLLVIV